eukprot:scaffold170600_cov31-Tisochrysis_lutea.AAC.5
MASLPPPASQPPVETNIQRYIKTRARAMATSSPRTRHATLHNYLAAAPASGITPSHLPCGSSPRALPRGSVCGISSGRRRVTIPNGPVLGFLLRHRAIGRFLSLLA